MELGELLYNKSEYIETVRACPHVGPPLSKPASLWGRCPRLVPAPPRRVPAVYGRVWSGPVIYSLSGQFRLFHLILFSS